MDTKEKIAAIKKIIFNAAPPVAPVAPAPVAANADTTLQDGTAVSIDKLEVGGTVLIAGVPPADGEFFLADGTNITVVGGKITEIESPAAEATEPSEEMKKMLAGTATPQEMQSVLQKFADGAVAPEMQKLTIILKAVFESVFGWELRQAQEKAVRDQAIAVYQSGFEKQEKVIKALFEIVEEMAATPVIDPVETKSSFRDASKVTKDERVEKISATIKELRTEQK